MFIVFISCLSVLLLLLILMLVNLVISESSLFILTREELTSYECGFEHSSLSRIPFSLRYFLLTIIFLVFDIEVLFLVLAPLSLFSTSSYSLYITIIIIFVWVLILGLLYEWFDGALEWVI